jgi:hypothetical protein
MTVTYKPNTNPVRIAVTDLYNEHAMDSLRMVARRTSTEEFAFDAFYEVVVALPVYTNTMLVVEKIEGAGGPAYTSYIISTFEVTPQKRTFSLKREHPAIVVETFHDVCFTEDEMLGEVDKMLRTFGNYGVKF